ncbi:MAG: hypothetical protein JSS86_17170 [Cyanobacteria bacterium SZAS LIN-2]|nr:hypothetical protein [Cyanobacteria bacterium SZAS LIN-2]
MLPSNAKIAHVMIPDRSKFTTAEWKVIQENRTPRQVQRYLRSLSYNAEEEGETVLSFRRVVKKKKAHCLEAALAAAVILEQHGYPPLVMSLESVDELDHVIYVFQTPTGWGSVARSRDDGLHGRRPVFRSARDLALSYVDPYVDYTGRIKGYAVADMNEIGRYDWRFSDANLLRVEHFLIEYPHKPLVCSERRYQSLLKRYTEFKEKYPKRQPDYYENRDKWM